ncbi:hypothetical protein ACFY0G_09700 [Streptomyces sp. NPDC001552]|uniref:hypothetical protein n=1 Tax=Streptomyces sp. NPDC001552 TaxID=3364587 RepID=UPI003699D0BC
MLQAFEKKPRGILVLIALDEFKHTIQAFRREVDTEDVAFVPPPVPLPAGRLAGRHAARRPLHLDDGPPRRAPQPCQ